MASEVLKDAIGWKTYGVPAGLAGGQVPVRIGTVGSGGPVGVLVASVPGKVVAMVADVTEATRG